MLKRLLLTGLYMSFAFSMLAQNQPSLRETITDKDIVYPTEMERNYDELLTKWSKEIKYASDCHSGSSGSVSFPDSVYIKRLYSLPTQMELVFNPVVRDYIEMYVGRRRNQVSYMLGKGKYFFPIFEEALDKAGLPLELKYLPVIESALNPIARSRVGATGLWQFMAPTGKMYDLEVNSLVDERRDPHKSTEAAARYLKDLYNIYKDWNLVIAAYNCGPGNVNKAMRRSGGQTDYWAIYPYLPRETRGYVPAFIAATYAMNYYEEHNICPGECNHPASMDSVVVDKHIHFQQIADVLNVDIDDLRTYNPQFKDDIVPGEYKPYNINLPIGKVSAFLDKKDAILTHKSNQYLTHRKTAGVDVVGGSRNSSGMITYRVKRGDSMARIANRYGVTTTQLKQWNGLSSNRLSVGRRLKIYKSAPKQQTQSETLAANTTNATASATKSDTTVISVSGLTRTVSVPKTTTSYYKIRRGDTWAGIAKKNKTTVAQIKAWNNTKSNSLIVGKTLKIEKTEYVEIQEPVKLPEPELTVVSVDTTYTAEFLGDYVKSLELSNSSSSLPLIQIESGDDDNDAGRTTGIDDKKIIYHKVKIGETVTQIAARYNVTKKDILSWNHLPSGMAKVGQRLLIYLPDTEVNSDNNNIGDAGARSTKKEKDEKATT
ncbi:LysM peptidoglycan-binding domain-containing protein [Dysgonomonas sp. 511]|uniref:LysM peptidoglycan-binding domain-containing protein n=1 Tax=Dysgonomonas sp. 511 TaxID=2302930 RepID=UPI0013D88C53|nr:LysM peptidoglycan-binding domain-containing protein [Dysgonomonas sp. 511]NDV78993.1 LysM peptidoglycan-binding domain-containing protein [Dysgonomonas sp. 511]